jgi:hypothetical protein
VQHACVNRMTQQLTAVDDRLAEAICFASRTFIETLN